MRRTIHRDIVHRIRARRDQHANCASLVQSRPIVFSFCMYIHLSYTSMLLRGLQNAFLALWLWSIECGSSRLGTGRPPAGVDDESLPKPCRRRK